MPSCTARKKVEQIEFYGGRCHFVDSASQIYAASEQLAKELNGHYMDQFTNAERATDWRGNNNIADSIFRQMEREPHPIPAYIVMSAGTGGTSATLGRYIRYQGHPTHLMVVDPETRCLWIAICKRPHHHGYLWQQNRRYRTTTC